MKPKSQTSVPQTAAELAAEFERQRQEQKMANALLSTRAEERTALLLSGTDDAVIEYDRRTVGLEIRRDRAAARIEAICIEHPLALDRELETARVALRTDAEQKREEGKAAYLRVEQKLREVATDLAIVFAADQAIASANANPVKDTEALRPVEADFRWREGVPDRIETVTRQRKVSAANVVVRPGMSADDADDVVTQNVVIPGARAVRPDPLYDAIEIPALRPGDSPLRVPGTPLGYRGHFATKLKPGAPLPSDDPATAAAEPNQDRSLVVNINGRA